MMIIRPFKKLRKIIICNSCELDGERGREREVEEEREREKERGESERERERKRERERGERAHQLQ